MDNSFELVNDQEAVETCKDEEHLIQVNEGEGSSNDRIENPESSSDSTQSESIFQGENQIYPSRRNAANIEHQNQGSEVQNSNAINLPANIKSTPSASESAPGPSNIIENESISRTQRRSTAEPVVRSEETTTKKVRRKSEEASTSTRPVLSENDQSDQANETSQCSTSSSSSEAKVVKTKIKTSTMSAMNRPVNILPVNRNLIDHSSNNLIAIGRKPQAQKVKAAIQKKKPIKPRVEEHQSPMGWQADKKTLKERIAHMYCNETLSDVFFVVGNEDSRQTIPAHKFVLSIGSVVFDAMFNGGLTPKNTDEPLEIELPDVEPPAFLALLNFLYSDEVNIGPESVMTTLYTAKKYAVPAMETACVDFLKQSLGADNAFMLLTQARFFDEPQLEQLCLELIDKSTLEALNGDGFTEIDLGALCDVLNRDTLRIRELHLFQATLRWSTAECIRRGMPCTPENKRAVLAHAIQLIRFPLMKIDEFALHVEPTMLLSDREMNKIFKYLAVNPSDRPILVYSDRPRCSISSIESVVSRFQRTENRWGYCGTPDRIKFTVDRRIFVVGLGLYGSVHGPHEYKTQIKIIHCGTGKTLAEHDTCFVCDGTSNPCRVCFKEPVEILPGVTYIASSLITGPDSFYGTKGLRRIVLAEGEVTFQFTYAAMNNNGTSVEDGQIPEIVFYRAQN